MIRFTVVMHPLAEQELGQLWLDAPDRPAVAEAANRIERELVVDAHLKGAEFLSVRAKCHSHRCTFCSASE